MTPKSHILAIDQGTTSSRSIVFDRSSRAVAISQIELPQIYPAPTWVEHDPEIIWRGVLSTARDVIARCEGGAASIAGIGISNQRETTLIWDRTTGKPIYNAIVWQDRRTADICERMRREGMEPLITSKTGLVLDAYFSATKIGWILDHVEGARRAAEDGLLAFGTVDSFLIWRLSGGEVHATDITNASRTMLFNTESCEWDEELLELFSVPDAMLPAVKDSSEIYGYSNKALFGRSLAIAGVAGDQQAALVGQACFSKGMIKSTYGTGCFMLMNTGSERIASKARLLSTPAYQMQSQTSYALEGSIFVAGAALQWLRDNIGVLKDPTQSAEMASRLGDNQGVYMVPAFGGLGAPYWQPNVRGTISGLTFDTTADHIVRAALESIAYQSMDLIDAFQADCGARASELRVDGGVSANDWFCQFMADILNISIKRPSNVETTALGAAFLAGLALGIWADQNDLAQTWASVKEFTPNMSQQDRDRYISGWREALNRTMTD